MGNTVFKKLKLRNDQHDRSYRIGSDIFPVEGIEARASVKDKHSSRNIIFTINEMLPSTSTETRTLSMEDGKDSKNATLSRKDDSFIRNSALTIDSHTENVKENVSITAKKSILSIKDSGKRTSTTFRISNSENMKTSREYTFGIESEENFETISNQSKKSIRSSQIMQIPTLGDLMYNDLDGISSEYENKIQYNQFCLRRSFSLGKTDIGYPHSYMHEQIMSAGDFSNTDQTIDFNKLLKTLTTDRITYLMLPIPESLLYILHHLLLPTLMLQIICSLLIGLFCKDYGWLTDSVFERKIEASFDVESSIYLPFRIFRIPLFNNLLHRIQWTWRSLAFVYVPLAFLHMIVVLDQEIDTPEKAEANLMNLNPVNTEEAELKSASFTLIDNYRSPRNFQIFTLGLILLTSIILVHAVRTAFYDCTITATMEFWRPIINTWIEQSLNSYYSPIPKKLTPIELENRAQLDAIQVTMRCCGMNGFGDWQRSTTSKFFTKEELLYLDKVNDTERGRLLVPFSCCKFVHLSSTNQGKAVECDHLHGEKNSLYIRGCVHPLTTVIVETWLKIHSVFLLPATLTLIPQLVLYLAALQPKELIIQLKSLISMLLNQRENARRLARRLQNSMVEFSNSLRRTTGEINQTLRTSLFQTSFNTILDNKEPIEEENFDNRTKTQILI